jgi:hypothetical protein
MGMTEFAEMMAKKYGIRKPETAPAASPPEQHPEIAKSKPNKAENFFMMDLMILKNSLAVRMGSVKDRLKKVNRYGWRDLRLLFSLVDRLQSQLMQTMPDSRWEYYSTLARSGRYHLDIEGPVRQGRMVLISDVHLAQLCETVMETECIMCLKTGKEVENCPIRQALLEVAPPTEIIGYSCEYAEAAGDLIEGKEVHI